MSTRPLSAGFLRRSSLEVLEREAVTNIRAAQEIVRRLGFSECQRRYGSPIGARDWPGSWFEPGVRDGCQFIATDWYPWWEERFPRHGADLSDAD